MTQHTLYQVDAFTTTAFKGNPAAVCLLENPQPDAWMQALAAEMNLSETAFLLPEGESWRLRWFTPTTEVDLCGHATLASAFVLFDRHPDQRAQGLTFHTRSGVLKAAWTDQGVALDFPAMPPEPLVIDPAVGDALGFIPIRAARNGDYFLFETADEAEVRNAQVDFVKLKALPMPEVIITARSSDPAYDFISRFFAPQLGINEDPVTGSAHCLLGPYWSETLKKTKFRAYQASPRGGTLGVRLAGQRVILTGEAQIIFRAELRC